MPLSPPQAPALKIRAGDFSLWINVPDRFRNWGYLAPCQSCISRHLNDAITQNRNKYFLI